MSSWSRSGSPCSTLTVNVMSSPRSRFARHPARPSKRPPRRAGCRRTARRSAPGRSACGRRTARTPGANATTLIVANSSARRQAAAVDDLAGAGTRGSAPSPPTRAGGKTRAKSCAFFLLESRSMQLTSRLWIPGMCPSIRRATCTGRSRRTSGRSTPADERPGGRHDHQTPGPPPGAPTQSGMARSSKAAATSVPRPRPRVRPIPVATQLERSSRTVLRIRRRIGEMSGGPVGQLLGHGSILWVRGEVGDLTAQDQRTNRDKAQTARSENEEDTRR